MYALIQRSQLIGIFTSKPKIRAAIETLIKASFELEGVHGHYHFKYTEIQPNQMCKQLFSLFTLHDEYFEHEVETDWNTGEILKL